MKFFPRRHARGNVRHIHYSTRLELKEHLEFLIREMETAENFACVMYVEVDETGYWSDHSATWCKALGMAVRLQHCIQRAWDRAQ